MNDYNEMLLQYIKDAVNFEINKTEITIVGGLAIHIHFPQTLIKTYDVDALTNNPEIERYGISTAVNKIKRAYGDYENDRIKIKSLSNDIVQTFVLGKERLVATKMISGRTKDIIHLGNVKEHYNDDIDWNKVKVIKKNIERELQEYLQDEEKER